MGWMNVAHLEARSFAGQATRPEGREAALVGDLCQWIGLIHELAELGRAKEFTHRCRRRLGIDQVVRHDRIDVNRAHALADGAFHAQEPNSVLVLHKLADRAHAPIAKMVNVVYLVIAVL